MQTFKPIGDPLHLAASTCPRCEGSGKTYRTKKGLWIEYVPHGVDPNETCKPCGGTGLRPDNANWAVLAPGAQFDSLPPVAKA